MKKTCIIMLIYISMVALNAQMPNMYTSGKNIYDVCGNQIILRGMNHAAFNWGFNSNYDVFAEIKQTGANAVRIPWYSNSVQGGGGALYDDLQWIDSAITRCARNKMIPIIDLHDETCNNSTTALLSLTAFYKQPAMLTIIEKHKAYLIINFANEVLYADWGGGSSTVYRDTYYQVIDSMRSYNIHVPIMIDAPDCAISSDVFALVGNEIKMHDPDTNIILSAHAYWYLYANNMDSVTVRGKLQTIQNTGLPIILGELANRQSNGVDECFYTIDYKPLLNICQEMNMSWLAWSWDNDVCAVRQMSTTGNFASLSAYGNDIVNNTNYGLINATQSPYLVNNYTCLGMGIKDDSEQIKVSVFKLYKNITVANLSDKLTTLEIFDVVGRKWMQKIIQPYGKETFEEPFEGIKMIRFTQQQKISTIKIY